MKPHKAGSISDTNENLFREKAQQVLSEQIRQGSFPLHNEKSIIEDISAGALSSVFKVTTQGTPTVIKTAFSSESIISEFQFLSHWEKMGCNTIPPLRLVESTIDPNYIFIELEHIDEPKLNAISDNSKIPNLTFKEIARAAYEIHKKSADTKGFGNPMTEDFTQGSMKTLDLWFSDSFPKESLQKLIEKIDNPSLHKTFEEAKEIIKSITRKTAMLHGDIFLHNIFDTEPLTFFDPFPTIHYEIFDIGYTLALMLRKPLNEKRKRWAKALISEYSKVSGIDHREIFAATVLEGFRKLIKWSEKEKKADNFKNLSSNLLYYSKNLESELK